MISSIVQRGFSIPRWGYWVFFGIVGFLLLFLEDEGKGHDSYAIAILTYTILIMAMIVRWVFDQVKTVIRLKNEKARTEVMHLQSQVNPHFFFNMLNNLYGWVDKDPAKAKALILNISDLMRYSIYEGQKDTVSLNQEITYLKNYIELQTSRYQKKIDINFVTDVRNENRRVLPLLYIILLENAFKHGAEKLTKNAFINVQFVERLDEISFTVENNFDHEQTLLQKGVGLENLKRRLQLVYPKKHQLLLSKEENIFKAHLTISKDD